MEAKVLAMAVLVGEAFALAAASEGLSPLAADAAIPLTGDGVPAPEMKAYTAQRNIELQNCSSEDCTDMIEVRKT